MKKNVLLIMPTFGKISPKAGLPFGILYLAKPLMDKNLHPVILDQRVDSNWLAKLCGMLDERLVCVGISSMTGLQIKYGLECAKIVKRVSKVPIVWGGVHATMLPEQTLRNKYVDIVVTGEGELTFSELASCLANNKDYKGLTGIAYKKGKKIFVSERREFIKNLDSVSELPYHLINMNQYICKNEVLSCDRVIEISTSRGCPHNCGFCYNKFFNKCIWRSNSVKNIIERVKGLKKEYKIDGINWREDNFFTSKNRVEEICKQLITNKLSIKWYGNCKLNYFLNYSTNFMKLLKKSGCSSIGFGIESASQSIANKLNKGITIKSISEVIKKAKSYNISINWHFMVGFPFKDGYRDDQKTVDLVKKLIKIPSHFIHGPFYYTPYPKTDLFKQSVKAGFVSPKSLVGWSKITWNERHFPVPSLAQRSRQLVANVWRKIIKICTGDREGRP